MEIIKQSTTFFIFIFRSVAQYITTVEQKRIKIIKWVPQTSALFKLSEEKNVWEPLY
jgi:hypothetical protein